VSAGNALHLLASLLSASQPLISQLRQLACGMISALSTDQRTHKTCIEKNPRAVKQEGIAVMTINECL
jgi:hypothetical protein